MRLADGPAGSRVQHLGVLAVLVGVLVFAMHSLNDVLDATRPNSEDQAVRVHARPEFTQPALDKEPAYHGRPPSPQVALVTDAARVSDGNDDVLLHPPAGNLSFARHLELAKLVCGPLCSLPAKLASLPFRNLSRAITVAEMRERFVRTPVDCARLFSPLAERLFDAPASMWPPPRSMPDELYDEYTLGGRMSNSTKYYTNRYSGGDAMHSRWSRRGIDEWVAKALNASLSGNYGRAYAGLLMGAIRRADVRDKRVLVIGSESPWVEAVCLAAGAAHVTTLEYGRIVSEHPNVSALLPSEMSRRYASGVVIPPFGALSAFALPCSSSPALRALTCDRRRRVVFLH